MQYQNYSLYYDSLILSLIASRELDKIKDKIPKIKMIDQIKDKYHLNPLQIKKQTKNLEKWITTFS